MKSLNFTEHIGELIGQNHLLPAMHLIQDVLKGTPLLDEAIAQSGRYNDLMRRIRTGQISWEDESITKNQIRFALLDLIREIEEQYGSNELVHAQLDTYFQKRENVGSVNIEQKHYGSGDNVAGNKTVNT